MDRQKIMHFDVVVSIMAKAPLLGLVNYRDLDSCLDGLYFVLADSTRTVHRAAGNVIGWSPHHRMLLSPISLPRPSFADCRYFYV